MSDDDDISLDGDLDRDTPNPKKRQSSSEESPPPPTPPPRSYPSYPDPYYGRRIAPNRPAPLPRRPTTPQNVGGQNWPPVIPDRPLLTVEPTDETVRRVLEEEKVKQEVKRAQIEELTRGGIVELSDPWKQWEFLSRFPDMSMQDVTGNVQLPANIRSGVENTVYVLFNELPLKQGRVYVPRPKVIASNIYVATNLVPSPGTNTPVNLNGASYTLRTAVAAASLKKFLSLELVFWTSTARTTKSTVAKDITLERLVLDNDGVSILSTFVIYQATDSFNPTERNASDLMFLGMDSIYMAQGEELRLTLGSTGSDIFADARITLEVRN